MNANHYTHAERERLSYITGDTRGADLAEEMAYLEAENEGLNAVSGLDKDEAFEEGKKEGMGPHGRKAMEDAEAACKDMEERLEQAKRLLGFMHSHLQQDLCKTIKGRRQLAHHVKLAMSIAGLGWPQYSHA